MATQTVKILNGKEIAARELERCRGDLAQFKLKKISPTLATVQAGDAKDVKLYAEFITRTLNKVGIKLVPKLFHSTDLEDKIIKIIRDLNKDKKITGIMVFSPLPKHLNPAKIFDNIAAGKDVEGRTFLKSHYGVFSPTAHAVLALIEETGVELAGKEAVVVGHSDLVGKPAAVLLADRMATVTICHKETKDLKMHVGRADVLVVAVGKAHLIPGAWIKPGAIVIDVGENVLNGKVVGDVEFDEAAARAAFITPVPGGVGPLTNVMLIKNLIRLEKLGAERRGNR